MKNILFIHGGGPTAVLNASLAGSISALQEKNFTGKVLFAKFGIKGLLKKDIGCIPYLTDEKLEKLSKTPGTAIGSGRDHLEPEDYFLLADILDDLDVGYVVMGGGNGTMDTARKLADVCLNKGINVVGVPKTIDNDLSLTDHSPGFPSAAYFLSSSICEVAMDVRSLPIHIVVIEVLGRNTGWLAASTSLSGCRGCFDVDMILFPEVPFEEEAFLSKVEEIYKTKGYGIVVASEGIKDRNGTPIVKPIFQSGRSVYFGDVSSHLSQLITKKLGIKSRSEKPGLFGRSSIAWQSETDRKEAFKCGWSSMNAALERQTGVMSIIKRMSSSPYSSEIIINEIVDEILMERVLDKDMIDKKNFFVTNSFFSYIEPLVEKQSTYFQSFLY